MKKVLTLTALLTFVAGVASASPAKISAQSIVVNPVQPKFTVDTWVNKSGPKNPNPVYRKGERVSISVKTTTDAYVYLFNVNADGNIDLFFPNRYETNNLVRAEVTRVFPGQGAKYTLSIGGPAGQDKLLTLASTKPLTIDDIAQFAGQEGFARVKVQGQDALAQAISVVVNPLAAELWTTNVTYFHIGPVPRGGATGGATGVVTQVPTQPTQPAPVQPAPTQPTPTPTSQIQPGEHQDGSFDSAMVDAYARLKGTESLGTPTTYAVPWADGQWQKFNGVAAYGDGVLLHANGSSRSYAVHGEILKRYLALANAENGGTKPPSRLGWAAGDEKIIPSNMYSTNGLYGFFQNGALYSTDKYGTFWLQGAVLKTYQGLGGSGSFLGFPTRDQYQIAGAWAADFEGGSIRTVNGVPKVYRK